MSKAKPEHEAINPRDQLRVLLAVREFLSDPNHWCKGTLTQAGQFCLRGARLQVLGWTGTDYTPLADCHRRAGELQFARLLGFRGIGRFETIANMEDWNDAPSTTHKDVLARLDAAIFGSCR